MSEALTPLSVYVPSQPPSFDVPSEMEAPTAAELYPEYNMCWTCNDIQLRCTCWPRDATGELIPADEFCHSCGGNCTECDCEDHPADPAEQAAIQAYVDRLNAELNVQLNGAAAAAVATPTVSSAAWSDACICYQAECVCDRCTECDSTFNNCYCTIAAQINAEIEMEEAANKWEKEHDQRLLDEEEQRILEEVEHRYQRFHERFVKNNSFP